MSEDSAISDTPQIPVEIGMRGFSVEAINKGEKGWCVMPLGSRDSTKASGRRWAKIKIRAMEDIRANREIIVGNEQGEVKEGLPVELSYEQTVGGFQRAGEENPLPVTMTSRALSWAVLTKTDANATAIITPEPGKKVRVTYVVISNNHAAVANVGITFSATPVTDGDFKLRLYVPADGGTIPLNLIDSAIEGAVNQPLYVYCAAAYANGVRFNIGYREEKV